MNPWKVKRTTIGGYRAEVIEFTGTTETEYDAFLDARFTPTTDGIGFRHDAGSKHSFLLDDAGKKCCILRPLQYRRYVLDELGEMIRADGTGIKAPIWNSCS